MIGFIVLVAQIAGPCLSAWIFFHQTEPAVMQYRAGNVMATLEGFYGPLAIQLAGIVLGVVTPWVAPQWRPILAWIRSKLPDNTPADAKGAILQSLADAAAAKRAEAIRAADDEQSKLLEELQAVLAKATGGKSAKRT